MVCHNSPRTRGKVPDMFGGLKIYDLVTREKANRTLQDTEEFIEYLHSELAGKHKHPRQTENVTVNELLISSLAQTDALAKLLIEKGLITREEFMQKISEERATYQKLFNPTPQ
jgi:hypothetical protein